MILRLLLIWIGLTTIGYTQSTTLDSLIQAYQYRSNSSDGAWPDISLEAIARTKRKVDSIYAAFENIQIDQQNEQDKINYDLFEVVLTNESYELDWGAYLMPLNSEGGLLSQVIYTFNNLEVKDDDSYNKYEKKLLELPVFLKQIQLLLVEGIKEGKISPKIIVERCISLMDFHMNGDVTTTLFYQPVVDSRGDYQRMASQHIQSTVLPAYESLRHYLQSIYLPAAPIQPGIQYLPNGKKYYEHKIKYYTTLDMTPDQVFKRGEEEVNRIKAEMEDVIQSLSFEGNFSDFLQFLRTDKQFYVEKPQHLLHYAAWLSKTIEAKLPKYFNVLPRNPFTVEPVPTALAPNYTGGRYSPGSYTNKRAGAYWVNTYNLASRPLYVMPALTLHEAVPGHHLQGSIAQEISLSDFRRQTYLSAFGEGWALYTEYLGKEMGIYTTPYEDFGRLTYEMWRACRLVVDVGLHYKGWSRDKAVEFMASNTALSMLEVNNEIDRYIGWPGQAVSYKIGELTIRDLRSLCEEKYKEDFDLATFHDNLLRNGSMPLSTLRYLIIHKMKHTKS